MNTSQANNSLGTCACTTALVSIIIPCYKMGKFIGDALKSIGEQTYQNWEVIVVDDCGPKDGTHEIVDDFARSHPEHRVELIKHNINRGVSAARNTAVSGAEGYYLAFLDPDDYWGTAYLASHIKKLESEHEISVSYTDGQFVNEQGAAIGELQGPSEDEWQNLPRSLYPRNFINPSTVVARKHCVVSCGGFDESRDIQHIEDWDLWLRLLDEGIGFSYTPEAKSYYRTHPEAATQDLDASINRRVALWKKHFHKEKYKDYMLRQFARNDFEIRYLKKELANIRSKMLRYRIRRVLSQICPSSIKQWVRHRGKSS